MRSIALAVLFCDSLISAPSSRGLTGSWVGTFKGQPEFGRAETVTAFELIIRQSGSSIRGALTVLLSPVRRSELKNGICDPEGCSFEVMDSDDHTTRSWRIWTDHGQLQGTRNGGRLTQLGTGAGARIFELNATRKSSLN